MHLSVHVRVLLSLVVGLHLGAVFVAPFAFNSIPAPGLTAPSPVGDQLMRIYRPYLDAMYLRHGYAFFAPDPGPSHIFRARLEFADGRPPRTLDFPDRRQQWPRLLYHRHFMLSERLSERFVPRTAPRELAGDPVQLVAWRRNREAYEAFYRAVHDSYADHLQHRYGAARVVITRYEHELLSWYDVLERGRALTDEPLYEINPDDVPTELLP